MWLSTHVTNWSLFVVDLARRGARPARFDFPPAVLPSGGGALHISATFEDDGYFALAWKLLGADGDMDKVHKYTSYMLQAHTATFAPDSLDVLDNVLTLVLGWCVPEVGSAPDMVDEALRQFTCWCVVRLLAQVVGTNRGRS